MLATLGAGCGGPADEPTSPASPSTSTPAQTLPVSPQQGQSGPATSVDEKERRPVARRPFWHDGDLVTQLGLDDARLSIMETRRQAALDAVRQERQSATARRGELSDALGAADWAEARRLVGALGQDAEASILADVELKIGILDMLSADQREMLLRERPNALRRSWLIPTGAGRPATGPNPLLDRRSPADPAPDS